MLPGSMLRLRVALLPTLFSARLKAAIRSMLMEPSRASCQSPRQNGVAERFVGTVRRELLDHVIVLSERHLRQLIESSVTHYDIDRTHIGVGKDSPCGPNVQRLQPTPHQGQAAASISGR
jgi:transposase InsO family protein